MSDHKEIFKNLNLLLSLFENSASATAVIDHHGIIKMANKEMVKICGYNSEELEGTRKWDELIIQEDFPILEKYLKLLRTSPIEHLSSIEIRFKDKADNLKTAQLQGVTFNDDKLIAFSLHDITEQKEYEKELFEAKEKAVTSEQLKNAFLANLSHEIRTPINAVVGFADLLKDEELPLEKRELYLDHVIHSSLDLLLLIGKIITISRLDSNQVTLSKRQFKLNDRLRDIFMRYEEEIVSRGLSKIKLSLHLGLVDDSFSIFGDPMRFNEVMDNLIENALKFTVEGEITIGYYYLSEETGDTSDSLLFYVKDSGLGVAKNKRDIIFNRFVKIIDRETIYKGAGLGLSIAKELVSLFGGNIWMEPNQGKGSIFYFSYPLKTITVYKSGSAKSIRSEKLDIDWSSLSILIAEDAESNYLFIKELLTSTGARILRARDGKEAVELFKKTPTVDVVIMDILMPNMDGYEATNEIRKIKTDIPVVAQTAFTFEGDLRDGLYAGCFNDYIMKPYTRKILIGVLSKYMPNKKINKDS